MAVAMTGVVGQDTMRRRPHLSSLTMLGGQLQVVPGKAGGGTPDRGGLMSPSPIGAIGAMRIGTGAPAGKIILRGRGMMHGGPVLGMMHGGPVLGMDIYDYLTRGYGDVLAASVHSCD